MERNGTSAFENSTNQEYKSYPEYQASLLIWKIVPPILIAFGSIGNILSIVVLTRPSIRRSTIALYLIVLAVSDLTVLYTGLLRQWLIYLVDFDVREISEAACKIHIWMVYSSLDSSAWIVMAVTLDRVIAAWFPHSVGTKCSSKHASALITAILIFVLGLNAHLLYGMVQTSGEEMEQICAAIDDKYGFFFHSVWPWVDFSAYCFIPFLVIVIGNCLIIFKVLKSQRRTTSRHIPSIQMSDNIPAHRTGRKQSSMTAMLMTLNTVFLFTTSPVSIYSIGYPYWHTGSQKATALMELWWAIVNMLMYINNSLNFLLYCLSGSMFRKEAKRIFCRIKKRIITQILKDKNSSKRHTLTAEHAPLVLPNTGVTTFNGKANTLQIPKRTEVHLLDTAGLGSSKSEHSISSFKTSNTCLDSSAIKPPLTRRSSDPIKDILTKTSPNNETVFNVSVNNIPKQL